MGQTALTAGWPVMPWGVWWWWWWCVCGCVLGRSIEIEKGSSTTLTHTDRHTQRASTHAPVSSARVPSYEMPHSPTRPLHQGCATTHARASRLSDVSSGIQGPLSISRGVTISFGGTGWGERSKKACCAFLISQFATQDCHPRPSLPYTHTHTPTHPTPTHPAPNTHRFCPKLAPEPRTSIDTTASPSSKNRLKYGSLMRLMGRPPRA